MKFPRLNISPAFFALLIAATSLSVSAAEKERKNDLETTPVGVQRLVIAKGVLENKKPATLRNVVDYISSVHPDANITLVGVDEVVIGDLVLRSVALFRPPEHVPGVLITSAEMVARKMPIEAMLTAVEAASGYKFKTRGFEQNTFVLLPPDGSRRPRTTEIFNLGTMKQSRLNAQVQEKIRELETELAVLRASYGEKHPLALDHLARLKVLNAQLQETSPSSSDSAKLVERIRDVVWGWLRAIARNAARDGNRKQRRYLARLKEFALGFHRPMESDEALAMPDDLRGLLREILSDLSPFDRGLIEGKYFRGETVAELAVKNDVTEKTVESRLARLRQQLGEQVQRKLRLP